MKSLSVFMGTFCSFAWTKRKKEEGWENRGRILYNHNSLMNLILIYKLVLFFKTKIWVEHAVLGKTSSNVLSVYGQKNFIDSVNYQQHQWAKTGDSGPGEGTRVQKRPIRHAHSPVGSVFKLQLLSSKSSWFVFRDDIPLGSWEIQKELMTNGEKAHDWLKGEYQSIFTP